MKKQLFYFLFSYFLCTSLNAHIYEIKIIRNWVPRLKKYQYIIGFSDLHDRDLEKTKSHQATLAHLFNKCNKRNTAVIVEDLSSTNQHGTKSCGTFQFDSRGGLLGGIAQEIQKQGFKTHNVEYRYCRAAGWGPLYSQMVFKPQEANPKKIPAIPLASVHQEVTSTIDVIQSKLKTDIPKPVHKKAKQIINAVKTDMKKMTWLTDTKKTINQCPEHFNKKTAVENLLTFDSPLMDLLIVDTINKEKETPLIIVIAGGTHINKSFNLLGEVGYESVYSKKVNSFDTSLIDQIIKTYACIN